MIILLGAHTGKGHITLLNTFLEAFEEYNIKTLKIDDFYEKCAVSNKILSDFYNFLLQTSIPLGKKYTEMAFITRPDKLEEIYQESKKTIGSLFKEGNIKIIISFAPLINNNILRYLNEFNLREKIKFYIVATDPYPQMAPGFDVSGADGYFCFSSYSKNELINNGIERKLITTINFPVRKKILKNINDDKKLLYKNLELDCDKTTILLNAGSNGNLNYIKILKELKKTSMDIQVVFLVGENKKLEALSKMENKESKIPIKVISFRDNISDIYKISDICITKPGANTFYECLNTKTIPLIDSIEGLLYQEEGVQFLLKEHNIGYLISSYIDIEKIIKKAIENKSNLIKNMEMFQNNNEIKLVVKKILNI